MTTPARELFIPETTAADKPLPFAAANHPFVPAFERTRWWVRPDGKLVPEVFGLSMQPGLGGIGESIRGDMARIFAKIKEQTIGRSYRVLSPNVLAGGRRSVRMVTARDPATRQEVEHWAWAWETFTNHTDRKGYDCALNDAFLEEWARVDGLPLVPDIDVIENRIAWLARVCEEAAVLPNGKDTERYRVHAAELAIWEAAKTSSPATVAESAGDLTIPEDEPKPARGSRKSIPVKQAENAFVRAE